MVDMRHMAIAGEMPAISSANLASNTYNAAEMADWRALAFQAGHGAALRAAAVTHANTALNAPLTEKKPMSKTQRRLVQVYIADPDENVPLEQCLLYSGATKLTDATDQELFFEIDVKALLDKHNEARVKLVNKEVKERVEYLEVARVRDLKMTVVVVAAL